MARKRRTPQSSRSAGPGIPGVFLDRDGTISDEVGYINHIERLRIFPWAAEAVRKINQTGWPVFVVTNQSGVARGYFSERLIREVHERIAAEFATHGARIAEYFYCPHHPTGQVAAYKTDCLCRKPSPGMIMEAARKYHLDLASSYVVGDTYRDMQMGFNAGTQTIMLMTGYGRGEYEYYRHNWPRMPDHFAENLLEATNIIVKAKRGRPAARRAHALVNL